MAPASYLRSAPVQILAATALTEIEGISHEETMSASNKKNNRTPGLPIKCANKIRTVSSITTSVPERHSDMITALKHFRTQDMPSGGEMFVSVPIAPAV